MRVEVQVQVELVGIVRMVSPEEFLSSCAHGGTPESGAKELTS